MSDNVNKEQQEAQMPSAQEEVVIEEVTEEDSTNETQEQEHTHEIDEPSSVFNALDSFLGKANGPNDWEEFCQATFSIFKEINDYYISLNSHVLSERAMQDIQNMAYKYSDTLHDFLECCQDEQTKQQLGNMINIWDLAVKLYVSPETSKKENMDSLVEWLTIFDPIEVNEDILDWDAVYRYILRGDIAEAIDLLVSFKLDKDESKSVELLCDLLKEYTNVQHETDLEDWKRKCALELESNQAKPELTPIYFLVMGNSDYIKRSGTFFDQLVGLVRYCGLYASKSEISALAGSLDVTEFHDRYSYVCAGLLLGHIDDALGACDDLWIQTHLGHLFLVLGVREDSHTSVNSALDYEVIVDPIYQMANAYAQHIADKYNMWTQAVVYINLCIPNRVVWIKTLLEHEKAKHIPLLDSVLETVDEYSINQVVSYIHKSIAQLYEKENDVYNATIEYGKAQDIQSLDRIGTDIFIKCLQTGKLKDNVVGNEELKSSPIYDCVAKYNDLRYTLEKQQYKEASRIVLDIFASNTLPDQFKPIIFIDADAILSTKESCYNQTELVELLDIFQSLLDALTNQSYFEQYYQHALGTKHTSDTIIAMLREKMAYRAITA